MYFVNCTCGCHVESIFPNHLTYQIFLNPKIPRIWASQKPSPQWANVFLARRWRTTIHHHQASPFFLTPTPTQLPLISLCQLPPLSYLSLFVIISFFVSLCAHTHTHTWTHTYNVALHLWWWMVYVIWWAKVRLWSRITYMGKQTTFNAWLRVVASAKKIVHRDGHPQVWFLFLYNGHLRNLLLELSSVTP